MSPIGPEVRRAGRWLAWALAAAMTVVRGAEPASFAGDWNCDWGVLRIELNGQRATGTAVQRNSRIEATVSADGRTLDGRWLQPPSFAGPKDAGRILLTLAADGNTFNGRWGYGNATDGGPWNGRRVGTSPPPPPPAARSSAKGDLAGSLFALGSALMELKDAGKALGDAISGNPATPTAAAPPSPPVVPEPASPAAEPAVVRAAPSTVVRAPTTGVTPSAPVVAAPSGAWVLARIEREEKRAPGPQGYDTYEQSEHSDTAFVALAVSPSDPVKISAEWKSPPPAVAPGRSAELAWSLGVAMTGVAGEGSLGFAAPGHPDLRVTKPGTGIFLCRFPADGAGADFVVTVAAAGYYESDGQVTIAWQKRRFVYVFDPQAVPP